MLCEWQCVNAGKLIIDDARFDFCPVRSIPPRTCLSQKLWDSFEDMSNVQPARDRPVLVTFKGTPWGTGSLNRARLQCTRNERWYETIPERRLHPDGPVLSTIWSTLGDYGYMGLLNNTIFCPQPAGTTGGFQFHMRWEVFRSL